MPFFIRFSSSKTDRELLLFRHSAPIRTAEDLLSASSPVTLDSGSIQYRDYPIPGVDYYYAVIDAGMYMIGKIELIPGNNTTDVAVRLPIGTGRVGLPEIAAMRPLPLPFLMITTGVERGDELSPSVLLPEKTELQPATIRSIDQLLELTPELAPESMQFQILDEDLSPAGSGEAYTLYTILQDQLLKGNYIRGETLLKNFLSIRHTSTVEARGRFYLAQAYYYLGKYRLAFMELLLAQEALYQPVQPWLNACYRHLAEELPL